MRSRHALGCAVLVVLTTVATACRQPSVRDPGFEPTPTPRTPATMLRRGIDVSESSGLVDWDRVGTAGLTFAVVRVTDGVEPDPLLERNWRGLSGTGLVRGALHRFHATADPDAQARAFLGAVTLDAGDLAPVVEVRPDVGDEVPADVADRLARALAAIEDGAGATPIIRTDAASWDRWLPATFGRHPLWIVDHKAQEPALPHGWERWHLWTFRVRRHDFAGVEHPVDLSGGNRRLDDLGRLLIAP